MKRRLKLKKDDRECSLDIPQNLDDEVQVLATDSCLIPNNQTTVGFRFGKTVNIGNYESIRLDFWQAVNCDPKDRDKVMKELEDYVLSKVSEMDKRILSQLKRKRR